MAAVLDRESQEAGSDSADAAAASVCGTIGNLLGPASNNAAVNQTNSTNMTSSQIVEEETRNQRVSEQVFFKNKFHQEITLFIKLSRNRWKSV